MGNDPEEKEEVKRLVLDELDRMSRMVEDLLLLARSEQADFLDIHPIDVREFTEEILTKAAALAPDRDWRPGEAADGVLAADRQRLIQALMNLARNAVEHGEPGSPITLSSAIDGDTVRFWVKDEGFGIPLADQERIFERFSRGRLAPRRSEGAGLGLSIVRTITSAHGGRVELDSKPGQGSTFTIVLPISRPGH
jgi:signal transduction histidine kinase